MLKTKGFHSFRKMLTAMLALVLILASLNIVQTAKAASTEIVNNSDWYDTDGNQIWSQGGWMMQEGNTFYWYGADYSVAGNPRIRLYTSTDMVIWTNQGSVVDFSSFASAGGFLGSDWLGRPVVQYNSSTSKYVMLLEWNSTYNLQNKIRKGLTFLTSDSPDGPFVFNNNDPLPSGYTMGDLGSIFKDDDGSTYISFTSDNGNVINSAVRINKLAPDYLSIVEDTKLLTGSYAYKEATSLFKRGSTYWLVTSGTHGWGSSAAYCSSASSLSGTWTASAECATSSSTTNAFDTQADQVLPIQGTSGTMYMYLGDRWNNKPGGSTGIGRNQWYPFTFNSSGVPMLRGYGSWMIDSAAGTWTLSPPSIVGVNIDVTKTYSITNLNSGKALRIAGNSTVGGAAVVQNTYAGAVSEAFKFYDAGDGYYKIQNVNSGQYLNIASASTADGAQVIQYTSSSNINQQWQIISDGSGAFKLKNRNSGKVMDISGASTVDGASATQSSDTNALNQRWGIGEMATDLDTTKTYSITNRWSEKALGIVGNSTADSAGAEQRVWTGAAGQTWQFVSTGDGYFKIKNVNSGKFINISGAALTEGAQVIQYTGTTSINQQWQLIGVGGGYYKIKNRNSGMFLSLVSDANGALVVQGSDANMWSQNFKFDVKP
ncbi:RICIN domain-containing protein [Paenibacillus oryzisoli]|uniref:RICIN domain-containing protein n=1 Tax=Paenibacillus oryzisoli TaxID=1850517 RepID=UPI003D27B67C